VLIDVGLGVEDREHLVEGSRRRLHRVVQLGELLDRLEQAGEQQHDRDHRADRHRTPRHQPTARRETEGGSYDTGQFDQTEVPGRHANAVQVGVEERPIRLAEPPSLLGHPRRRLDNAHPSQILLD